ncbi:MAG: exopolysaccharide biosynthesis polyprenyl glycosylphosphotransferase [Rhodomicrobium sp.]|nr:exopolysaccharide biosynthesis polyprenyl glycosylphosphotransferase [Rhodomicrobium sp.]
MSNFIDVVKYFILCKKPVRFSALRDSNQSNYLLSIIEIIYDLPVNIKINNKFNFDKENHENYHVTTISDYPLDFLNKILKRTFDIFLSVLIIFFVLPLIAMIAIAIKLDSTGPIFFRQKRGGIYGRHFRIFKFRTMNVLDDGHVIAQAVRGDKRITRVGAFLRRTNLDELPQLFNVILGDMSVVGPRPHAAAHDDAYSKLIPLYTARYKVKPGITGWSQVNGYRGETETIEKMYKRVKYDIFYINNWSILFDFHILIMTCFSKESFKNAH